MRKTFFGIATIIITIGVSIWNFNKLENKEKLTNSTLELIEALAYGEREGEGPGGGGGGSDCYKCAYNWRRLCDDVNSLCAGDRMYIFPL